VVVKDNMAMVRNRVLLLLSSKKASEISTVEGKQQLASEIQTAVTAPFVKDGDEQEVTDVLFTSFIIQ
jgi:flagellar FliL protein